jgi:hypothetical protein
MLKIPGRSLLAALAELAALGLEVGPEFRPGRVPQQQPSPAQQQPVSCGRKRKRKTYGIYINAILQNNETPKATVAHSVGI